MEPERRDVFCSYAKANIETRDDGSPSKIKGYGAVFYDESDPGTEFRIFDDMIERIMPGFFDDVVNSDVRGLFNHDFNYVLGRTKADPKPTMRIGQDKIGLWYEIDIPEVSYANDILTLIQRGDVTGSSFSFTVAESRIEDDGETMIRYLVKAADVFDVGPVTIPAYKATTTTSRALQERREYESRQEPLNSPRSVDYDDTEEIPWADVPKTFQAFRDAYYTRTDAERPDDPPGTFTDAPMAMRRWMARHSVLGNPESNTFDIGVLLPIVNPQTGSLNQGAVVAANRYAEDVSGLSDDTVAAVKSYLSNLYESEWGGDEEEQNSVDLLALDVDIRRMELSVVEKY